MSEPPRWWSFRKASNLSAAVYTCPLCGERVPALMEHTLIFPEGRSAGRRHAHTNCVFEARRSGLMLDREEFKASGAEADPGRSTDA